MNAIGHPQIFMRSLAAGRRRRVVRRPARSDCRLQTGGIRPGDGGNRRHRPGDAAIAALADVSLYVMTPEFGAASQLEKIDMLDFADCVAINKFDRKGGGKMRDVRSETGAAQSRPFRRVPAAMPVFGTQAARFNDDGVTALYQALVPRLVERVCSSPRGAGGDGMRFQCRPGGSAGGTQPLSGEIATGARLPRPGQIPGCRGARERQALVTAGSCWAWRRGAIRRPGPLIAARGAASTRSPPSASRRLAGDCGGLYRFDFPSSARRCTGRRFRETHPRVSLPQAQRCYGDLDLLPHARESARPFPLTAGVFPSKREARADPHVCRRGRSLPHQPALPPAFRGHGRQTPVHRLRFGHPLWLRPLTSGPDIYGKIGNAGVSVATLDDMKALYAGFDLGDPPPRCR